MRHSPAPSLPRMPGSAILAVVFLGLAAAFSLISGLSWLASIPGLGGVLLAGGTLATVLAIGISRRRRWARTAGIVWACVMSAFFFIEAMRTVGTTPANYSGLLGFWLVLLVFLCQRNTRLWCDNGSGSQPPSPRSAARPRRQQAAFANGDEVELLEDVSGLQAGTVGTVIDADGSQVVVVGFLDPDTGRRIEVALRAGEIRATAEAD